MSFVTRLSGPRAAVRALSRCLMLVAVSASLAHADTVTVATAAELENAIAGANSNGGNRTILLRDGTYAVSDTLYVNSPNVTIAGQSGVRERVVIEGDSMSSTARIGNVIRVAARNFRLSDVTLQKSGWHLVQIVGEADADSPVIRNCILRDAYQQMLKVSNNPSTPNVTSDNGLVENCIFEYSAATGPQYYIGGIDAHGSKNWIVRNNTFRRIASPDTTVAEFAVHFWDGSADNTVERNTIVNCDRGVGFGLDAKPNTGGIIRNNMIYHAQNAGQFADSAIALIESPGTQAYNNTIFLENSFPWAIEYRFSSTSNVLIVNNLTNKPITGRDGASGTVSGNVTNAVSGWFVNTTAGDLHLRLSPIASVTGAAQPVSGLFDDFDGQPRPQGTGIDVGADQFMSTPTLPAPANLRVVSP